MHLDTPIYTRNRQFCDIYIIKVSKKDKYFALYYLIAEENFEHSKKFKENFSSEKYEAFDTQAYFRKFVFNKSTLVKLIRTLV